MDLTVVKKAIETLKAEKEQRVAQVCAKNQNEVLKQFQELDKAKNEYLIELKKEYDQAVVKANEETAQKKVAIQNQARAIAEAEVESQEHYTEVIGKLQSVINAVEVK